MMTPPTNSLAANCHPIRTMSTIPNSMTRLVEATMNTSDGDEVRSLDEERFGHGGRRHTSTTTRSSEPDARTTAFGR